MGKNKNELKEDISVEEILEKTIEGNKIVKEVKENGRYLINTENGLTFNISEEEYLEYVK